MRQKAMEFNRNTLHEALKNLPQHEPDEEIWTGINTRLNEESLQNALKNLPEFEPDEKVWELIEQRSVRKVHVRTAWWYAAAFIILGSTIGFWISEENNKQPVSYSQETVDMRLQVRNVHGTDHRYRQLKSYCETETLVCSSKDFKRLNQEYEILRTAGEELQKAMGKYNTEPGLIRQLSMVEQQKAYVLNQMAKMI
jgi:hypothetical protein